MHNPRIIGRTIHREALVAFDVPAYIAMRSIAGRRIAL
jgi:hypothetical protein